MDTSVARSMLIEAAQLMELASTYQVRYGRQTRLKPGSSDDAWTLYQAALDSQCEIARLIDPAVLEAPNRRRMSWWERQDVVDTGVVREIIDDIGHLIACCAYAQAEAENGHTEWSYAVESAQSVIAGLLHPTSLQVALDTASRRAG